MATTTSHGNHPTAECVWDSNVLNEKTIYNMTDMGLSIFANLCGRNRGAFVLPRGSGGKTYSCLHFPKSWGVKDSNDIKKELEGGNMTGHEAVHVLQKFNKAVYDSSGAGVRQDPYACNVNGLAKLVCPSYSSMTETLATIRAVTTAGLFVDAPWATKSAGLLDQTSRMSFYTRQDFVDMSKAGLNTVLVPVPLSAFLLDQATTSFQDNLTTVLADIQHATLSTILQLHTDSDDLNLDGIKAAMTFAVDQQSVLAVQLPPAWSASSPDPGDYLRMHKRNKAMIQAARQVDDIIPLFVTVHLGLLQYLNQDLIDNTSHLYAALALDHTSSVEDVASSSSEDDRMKMFYHESTSCMKRSPIEYSACYKDMPVFVSSGFDLAIDNCVWKETDTSGNDEDILKSPFVDYGQCDRFDETIHSDWWARHRLSFAKRQLYAYEQGLGWTYAAWKLYGEDDDDADDAIDSPAKLLSLRAVMKNGLFPKLGGDDADNGYACLNPPVADFALGDDTMAPTPGPPPDCGNGWWNESIQDCTYWIPPPPPTPCPTLPPTSGEPTTGNIIANDNKNGILSTGSQQLSLSFVAGAVVAGIVTWWVGRRNSRRRTEYSTIPN